MIARRSMLHAVYFGLIHIYSFQIKIAFGIQFDDDSPGRNILSNSVRTDSTSGRAAL